MAEQLLSGSRQQEETDFAKRHLAALGTQKVKYPGTYALPVAQRAKRAPIVDIPLCPPPEPIRSSASTSGTLSLTIKSLKPSLSFTVEAKPTETVAELKAQLAAQANAPSADNQRLLLKGKALADNKLLKEYTIETGATIHLMIKTPAASASMSSATDTTAATAIAAGASSAVPASLPKLDTDKETSKPSSELKPATSRTHTPSSSLSAAPMTPTRSGRRTHVSTPSLTLSAPPPDIALSASSGGYASPSTILAPEPMLSYSPHSQPKNRSTAFLAEVASPELWSETYTFLEGRFKGDGESARMVFEQWFSASKEWLTPSEIAKIRDATGIHGMAGY
ncbi:uncharacterized protein L969DRAFT_48362 [Mixia osmundae IAM 14324]|uniref:Ubiquitin-like domain-containing protein n=1 Tax=Mixia osmundae (strain CBS 9802 / IAM 14324 / JCM 22182 / KY 12970) TaxID=764103 RepID=G7EA14_MIXOS|nr:uncharacterized protein L969DRAFT_48362 [Mixia osmundae IAM 14324]KEI40361.1 hypothetical protein L969DRAFT_48362 [Mixia osmundae IAM 14324]GAA99674.1 hypothetical protein E5Q_06377 [Mixia osmundae IAM 14324]